MIVRAFHLTYNRIRDLQAGLRREGLSQKDCSRAVAAVKKWLQRDAEEPENTPRDVVVPDESSHP